MGAGEGDAAAGNKEKGGGGGVDRTSLDGVRDKNVMQLKKLNTALFPVRYNEKYYHDTIASKEFSKLGLLQRYMRRGDCVSPGEEGRRSSLCLYHDAGGTGTVS
ncbi:Os01g0610400 [Oryza sativa Japonica Group]|uniref:Os01g0610400 protein n=1 Tax=Oryza sativa subsp. japonica TaxID=39947 RepID=Q0JLC0_ORYSJ|nr:Os01g0610400 [Oryza sativa Japonica Group]|eukprot:NP_001043544.2 Os01g0610400 [Oryza sativa Japonica Group]